MRNHSFLTSVIDRIPSPLGPKPSSIFNDKSALLFCKKKKKKNQLQKFFQLHHLKQTHMYMQK